MGIWGGSRGEESRGGGSWYTTCAQDPRFNLGGTAFGMFGAEKAINDAILAKQKALGLSDADMDKLTIETSFMKD